MTSSRPCAGRCRVARRCKRSFFPDLTDEEQTLVDYLKERGEGQINRMTVELDRPLSQLLSVLVELEFKGVVKALPGGVYKL